MTDHFWLGMAIILVSGTFTGSFALPMKYSHRWRWENTWVVFSLLSLVIYPLLLATIFAPPLRHIYHAVSGRTLLYILAFGLLWGIAQTTFGLGIEALGVAFAFAVVSGLSCLSGSLIPLVVLSPGNLLHARGILLLISMPVLLGGLILCAVAGRRREHEVSSGDSAISRKGVFTAGLAICIFTGVFGSSINLGFAFSGNVLRRGLELGATPITSTYPVWVLVLGAGFIPNLLYCAARMRRNRTGSLFLKPGWIRESMLAVAMASIWIAGITGYGIGATLVGKYGTSIGFTLLTASQISSANAVGMLTGEWKHTSGETKSFLAKATAVILVSVVILNLGGLF
jgi:L-rhamnose-H+ transport protein